MDILPGEITTWEQAVGEWAVARADALALDPTRIRARYRWNPGGLVNASFGLCDGQRRLHVKLAPAASEPALRRWITVADRLASEYHAPALVRVETGGPVEGTALTVVMEAVGGSSLGLVDAGEHLFAIAAAMERLHDDGVLSGMLADAPRDCAAVFRSTYQRRWREDLEQTRPHLSDLSWVSPADWAWCEGEVNRLSMLPDAFAAPADAVTHGDLHWDNLLVEGPEWHVLDWDDISGAGDPALDDALLWEPLLRAGDPDGLAAAHLRHLPAKRRTRAEFYRRATLLDDAVDVLADAAAALEYDEEIRRLTWSRAETLHERALRLYRARYPAEP